MVLPSGEEYEAFFEASPVAIAICTADRVARANAAFVRFSGCRTLDEALALHPVDDLVVPSHQQACRDTLARLLAVRDAWETQFVPIRRRDGSVCDALVRSQSFFFAQAPHVFATFVDVSDMLRERDRLAELAQAVDTISEAIIVAGPSLAVTYANRAACELFGAEPERFLGVDVRRLPSPILTPEQLRDLENLPQLRQWSQELLMRRFSGEDFPAHLTISLVYDAKGREVARIGIVRDITAQKQAEAERRLRERQLALMLREAHHRIQNNLQVASDVLMLQAHAASSPEVCAALTAAAERLRALSAVHQWISPDQDVGVIEARHILETVVRSLRETLTFGGATIRFVVTADDCRLASREATAVALIVTELLTNAIRHAAPTAIEVQLTAADETACLQVTDDGPNDQLLESPTAARGFGLELIRLMAEEQLHGAFTLQRVGPATIARVVFPRSPSPTP